MKRIFTVLLFFVLLPGLVVVACGGEEEGAAGLTPTPPPPLLTVHFIDVGQGDAILVEKGDVDILVDGGLRKANVVDYLQGQEIDDIDLLVATHLHADHIGGLGDVLGLYDVQEIWTNVAAWDRETDDDFVQAVVWEHSAGATLQVARRGRAAELDGLHIAVLHPLALTGDTNADSVVLRLTCGTVDVLVTGDATLASEESMLDQAGLLTDVEVLKVGHHGSNTSTGDAFLGQVTPEEAVISVGEDNQYGHPHDETLERLIAHDITIYRTDRHHTVILRSDDCSTYSIGPAGDWGQKASAGSGSTRPVLARSTARLLPLG